MKTEILRIFHGYTHLKHSEATHTIKLTVIVSDHLFDAWRKYYAWSSFNQLYADMLEEVMGNAVHYLRDARQYDIDERRALKW